MPPTLLMNLLNTSRRIFISIQLVMERCDLCDRSFSDGHALHQHIRDAPIHSLAFRCLDCNRTFVSQSALDQHIRDSSVHAITYKCDPCDKTFGSQSALDQHIQNSLAHAVSFKCDLCNRRFLFDAALKQHIQYSKAHIAATSTPLDEFFRSFIGFMYKSGLPPSESYAQLKEFRCWEERSPLEIIAWKQYQSALKLEVRMWFGAEDDLSAWHSLCRAIGIEPLPVTCGEAVKAIRGVFVNIIDLIAWARNGSTSNRVQKFSSLGKLRAYTKRTNKVFSNIDGDDDGNIVLRHLLRFIFRGANRD